MDTVMFDTSGQTVTYQGITTLRDVEFYKMGQVNNFKAALRFENSKLPADSPLLSSVTSVAIHESAGWGIAINSSDNITLENI